MIIIIIMIISEVGRAPSFRRQIFHLAWRQRFSGSGSFYFIFFYHEMEEAPITETSVNIRLHVIIYPLLICLEAVTSTYSPTAGMTTVLE
jgi:hypothetical protein